MPVFVHLTSHRNLPSIRRAGLTAPRRGRGIYAMPMTPDFALTHQWLRELRRFHPGTMVGVVFRIPGGESVEIGHYRQRPVSMTASEAVAQVMKIGGAALGHEVVIARAIGRNEILRIRALPQVVGWRYHPEAHGKPPVACVSCERGTRGIGRLLRAVERIEARGRTNRAVLFGREAASFRRVNRLRQSMA